MQLAALKKAGCKTVFKHEVTGAHVNRPALARSLKTLDTGDTLIGNSTGLAADLTMIPATSSPAAGVRLAARGIKRRGT
jgi:hypothetical protein